MNRVDPSPGAESDLPILTKRVFMNPISILISLTAKPVCTSCHLWKGPFQVTYTRAILLACLGSVSHRVPTTFQDKKDIFQDEECDPHNYVHQWQGAARASRYLGCSAGERVLDTRQTGNLVTGMSF